MRLIFILAAMMWAFPTAHAENPSRPQGYEKYAEERQELLDLWSYLGAFDANNDGLVNSYDLEFIDTSHLSPAPSIEERFNPYGWLIQANKQNLLREVERVVVDRSDSRRDWQLVIESYLIPSSSIFGGVRSVTSTGDADFDAYLMGWMRISLGNASYYEMDLPTDLHRFVWEPFRVLINVEVSRSEDTFECEEGRVDTHTVRGWRQPKEEKGKYWVCIDATWVPKPFDEQIKGL